MSLTNRILIGMLGGILLGSLLNLIAHGRAQNGLQPRPESDRQERLARSRRETAS